MLTQDAPRLAGRRPRRADDVAAIERIVADIETALNTNDAGLAVRHFAADARAVDVRGRTREGAEDLLEAHLAAFAGPLAGQFVRYDVADIAFVRPDVALAFKHATATDADGTPVGVGHAMVALYVLVREHDRWWIAARQNTLVPE